jgi:hypothetical protein
MVTWMLGLSDLRFWVVATFRDVTAVSLVGR